MPRRLRRRQGRGELQGRDGQGAGQLRRLATTRSAPSERHPVGLPAEPRACETRLRDQTTIRGRPDEGGPFSIGSEVMTATVDISPRNVAKVRVWDWPTRAIPLDAGDADPLCLGQFRTVAEDRRSDAEMASLERLCDPDAGDLPLIWGLVGSPTARFANFVTMAVRAMQYGLASLRGQAPSYLGHNPLGGWMIVILLAAVATQGILGLYTLEHNEIVAGPLKRTISDEWSRSGANGMCAVQDHPRPRPRACAGECHLPVRQEGPADHRHG